MIGGRKVNTCVGSHLYFPFRSQLPSESLFVAGNFLELLWDCISPTHLVFAASFASKWRISVSFGELAGGGCKYGSRMKERDNFGLRSLFFTGCWWEA